MKALLCCCLKKWRPCFDGRTTRAISIDDQTSHIVERLFAATFLFFFRASRRKLTLRAVTVVRENLKKSSEARGHSRPPLSASTLQKRFRQFVLRALRSYALSFSLSPVPISALPLLHSPVSALLSPLRFLSSQRESLVLSSSSPHYSFLPPSPGSRKKRYHDEIGQALLRYGAAAAVARLHLRLRLRPAKGRVRLAVCGPQRRPGHMEEERDVPPALRPVCHDAQRDRRLRTCPGGALGAQGGDRRLRRRARFRRRGPRGSQDQPRRQGWHPPRARDARVGLRRRQGQGQGRRRRRSGQRCPRGELPERHGRRARGAGQGPCRQGAGGNALCRRREQQDVAARACGRRPRERQGLAPQRDRGQVRCVPLQQPVCSGPPSEEPQRPGRSGRRGTRRRGGQL